MSAPDLQAYIQGQGVVGADNLNSFEQTCDTAVQLRAFIGLPGMQVFLRGISAVGDGGQGAFYWNPLSTGPDDDLDIIQPNGLSVGAWVRLTSLSDPIPATNVTFVQNGAGAVTRTAQSKMRDIVSVKDFGAACDGVTDDTVAIQAALDACNSLRGTTLVFPGPLSCLISSSLIINRMTDTRLAELVMQGLGGGILVKSDITIFDSSTAAPTIPVSEFITFQNMNFECDDASRDAYVMTKKFLRINFRDCVFQKIKFGNYVLGGDSWAYAQDYSFENCNARNWEGVFFYAHIFYALNVISNTLLEFGDEGFVCGLANGCVVQSSVMEGSDGHFFKADGCNGVLISGNYTEGNTPNPDYVFADVGGGGTSEGVAFLGNKLNVTNVDPTFYPVIVGDTRGFFGAGNYGTINIYDDTATLPGELVSHDFAVGNLRKSTQLIDLKPTGYSPCQNNVTAHAGGGQASATQLTAPLCRVTVAASAADSVKLPVTFNKVGTGQQVTIVNDTGNSIQVFGQSGDSINFAASATGVPQASSTTKTYYSLEAGRWSA